MNSNKNKHLIIASWLIAISFFGNKVDAAETILNLPSQDSNFIERRENECLNAISSHVSDRPHFDIAQGDLDLSRDGFWQRFIRENGEVILGLKSNEYTASYLGQGMAGGRVYLIRDKASADNPFVLKIYNSPQSLDNDIQAFDFIESLILNSKVPLKIAQRERLGSIYIKLQYIPGQTAQAILAEREHKGTSYREDIKNQLTNLFRAFYNRLYDSAHIDKIRIVANDQFIFRFNVIQPLPNFEGHRVQIFLKTDNIMVDTYTLDLWLIDPF